MRRTHKHDFLSGLLAVAMVALANIGHAAPAPPEQPAAPQTAADRQHVGQVVFVELVTPDIARAKRFYAGLFGWTFRDIRAGSTQYAEAALGGPPIAALTQKEIPPGERRQSAWLSFIAVSDVDQAVGTALQLGASVLLAPRSRAGRGRQAVLADPQGGIFGILACSGGAPPDQLAAHGTWIWNSLITPNPDTDVAFYQKVFGYQVFDWLGKDSADNFILASGGYARASVNALPGNRPHTHPHWPNNTHPHWLNFVRVDDAAASAAKAVELGGRVLVEPRFDRHGGKVALVADPAGAPFGLLEWPANDTQRAAK